MNRANVAIVTGSSRGIGRGIALALAARGWHIVINYRSNREAAEEARRESNLPGGGALVVQADMASPRRSGRRWSMPRSTIMGESTCWSTTPALGRASASICSRLAKQATTR